MYTWDVLFWKSNRSMVTLLSWVNRAGIGRMATFQEVDDELCADALLLSTQPSSSLNNLVEEHVVEPAEEHVVEPVEEHVDEPDQRSPIRGIVRV
jgi:hypothetical protein